MNTLRPQDYKTTGLQDLQSRGQRSEVRGQRPAVVSGQWSVVSGQSLSGLSTAFSLIEILVTITLLSFIVIGLLIMFNQTQRAFKAGMMQTDVLENGRATIDMIVRDLELLTPSHGPNWPPNANPKQQIHAVNFYVAPDPVQTPPLLQYLAYPPGSTPMPPRTNVAEHFFILSQFNQDWIGTGYQIIRDNPSALAGSLYRFTSTNAPRGAPYGLFYNMYDTMSDSATRTFTPPYNDNRQIYGVYSGMTSNRIADGVVHLRVRTFDRNGAPLFPDPRALFGALWPGWQSPYQLFSTNITYTSGYRAVTNTAGGWGSDPTFGAAAAPDEVACVFWSNAVPAYVELELGILEPKVLQRYKSIGYGTPAGRAYLSNNVAQVHLFRQRIPIRNVDFTAYP